jgi:hypothetical protein
LFVVYLQKDDITEYTWTIPNVTKEDFESSWNIFAKSDRGETNVPVKLEMIIPPTTTETPGTTPIKTHDPNESHVLKTDPPTSVKPPEERCCECPGKGPYQNIAGLIYTHTKTKNLLCLPIAEVYKRVNRC